MEVTNSFTDVMDILELSKKLEGDLLDSRKNMLLINSTTTQNYSPRVTRSKTCFNNRFQNVGSNMSNRSAQTKMNCEKMVDIENLYLNRKPKVVNKNLETIYESPVRKKGNVMFVGTSKVKRRIYLNREFRHRNKLKSKLRKMKIKKLGKNYKPFKMTDDEFKNRMLKIDKYINDIDVLPDSNSGCDVDIQMDETSNKTDVLNITLERNILEDECGNMSVHIIDTQGANDL